MTATATTEAGQAQPGGARAGCAAADPTEASHWWRRIPLARAGGATVMGAWSSVPTWESCAGGVDQQARSHRSRCS